MMKIMAKNLLFNSRMWTKKSCYVISLHEKNAYFDIFIQFCLGINLFDKYYFHSTKFYDKHLLSPREAIIIDHDHFFRV